jgi:hypothetical protein
VLGEYGELARGDQARGRPRRAVGKFHDTRDSERGVLVAGERA